ncbi:unnamed protein product [Penicillium roqueforti FM164]|uniref:Genomic scaffold, ProqFM164S02 n=1 Tax=Penicillium roqueforti (strain FM164) TaxID=1365484 RepID=W6Q2B3_PENRF|nr:unnamed protein product [Penicillium roqueforti FM164]
MESNYGCSTAVLSRSTGCWDGYLPDFYFRVADTEAFVRLCCELVH